MVSLFSNWHIEIGGKGDFHVLMERPPGARSKYITLNMIGPSGKVNQMFITKTKFPSLTNIDIRLDANVDGEDIVTHLKKIHGYD